MKKATKKTHYHHSHGGNAFYALGGIGALVYFLQQANGGGEVVIAILKSIVWPAFFIHKIFIFLGM